MGPSGAVLIYRLGATREEFFPILRSKPKGSRCRIVRFTREDSLGMPGKVPKYRLNKLVVGGDRHVKVPGRPDPVFRNDGPPRPRLSSRKLRGARREWFGPRGHPRRPRARERNPRHVASKASQVGPTPSREREAFDATPSVVAAYHEGPRDVAGHGRRRRERGSRRCQFTSPPAASWEGGRRYGPDLPSPLREGGRRCPAATLAATSDRGTLEQSERPNVSIQSWAPNLARGSGQDSVTIGCNALFGKEGDAGAFQS